MEDLIIQSAQFVMAAIIRSSTWDKIKQIFGAEKAKHLEATAKESQDKLKTILELTIQSDQEIQLKVQKWMESTPEFKSHDVTITGDNNVVVHEGSNISTNQSGGFNVPNNQGSITISIGSKEPSLNEVSTSSASFNINQEKEKDNQQIDDTFQAKIFYSYSHIDEDLRNELEVHMKPLQRRKLIKNWHDRKIDAGSEWGKEIDHHLNSADIILLLISSDFIASDYCYENEMERAMERHENGEAIVIPVFLRNCRWKELKFGKLQGVPDDAKPIVEWENRDKAYTKIVEKIEDVVKNIQNRKAENPK